ncbi:MAG: hypothetical protein HY904_01930 [Deltaproteobacteria bacterium]|nr:hypothetical protein [Deltaproteobacteria bacterium]
MTTTRSRKRPQMAGRQTRALSALLSHHTVVAAARAAGVGERTLRRWLASDAAFQAEYRAALRDLASQIALRPVVASETALDVLTAVMEDPGTPASVRVAAAGKVIDAALRIIEKDGTLNAHADGAATVPAITGELSPGVEPPSEADAHGTDTGAVHQLPLNPLRRSRAGGAE